ncbi:MAG TPA: type II secretion system F family protein, partial [Burkholderiales bacterium]
DEFKALFDEVNYGASMQEALLNLAGRIPSTDVRYLVIAVLIQRETGGNLAELLNNIGGIIRARLKLFGAIRVLSAEGRLSAWILSMLPFAAALLIQLVNPRFMSVLWTDPAGTKMIGAALTMMAFGVLWMRRIIRIRV